MLRQAGKRKSRAKEREKEQADDGGVPLITIGTKSLSEAYIPDLTSRLSIYRRIASLQNEDEMNQMMTELIDRWQDSDQEQFQKSSISNYVAVLMY